MYVLYFVQAKLVEEADVLQIKEEKDLVEKVSQCMQVTELLIEFSSTMMVFSLRGYFS